MIDASEVERALVGALAADPELAALLPDGVHYDLAPHGATRFVIVSLSTSRGLPELNDRDTSRSFVYLIKAVALGADRDPIAAADARIQAILDHGTLDLPPAAGGSLMALQWVDRVRYTELSAGDTWQHRGARYDVTVTPTT